MKHLQKLATLALAVLMVFAMATTAMAAMEGTIDGGSIAIDNAVSGQTYEIYQILYLESYNAASNAYAYKANSAWVTFINSETIKGVYVNVDTQDYVTWVEGADAAAFAKLAQAHADKNSIPADGTKTATSTTVEFTGLKLGYYLVDTTLGTLCSLDTTNPSVTIKEKNEVPSIDKTVKEDSTGEYGDSNTAQVGDTVEFKTVISAKPGAVNYVLHDTLSDGLTLNQNSIAIEGLTLGTHYTVSFETTDGCDFEITFAQAYLDTITANTDITVTYTAILNDKAVISTDVNTNTTHLAYGGDIGGTPTFKTEDDKTETFTFSFKLVKTDSNNKLLTGATFELYDAATNGNKIALVKESDGVYRIATNEEQAAEGFTSAVIEGSTATIEGLDANTTYYLQEVTAPAGYNKLAERVPVEMKEENLDAVVTDGIWTEGGVHVVNQSGTELPSTGGIGTTIFYVAGALLVVGAVVMLVTKKRLGKMEE